VAVAESGLDHGETNPSQSVSILECFLVEVLELTDMGFLTAGKLLKWFAHHGDNILEQKEMQKKAYI
jgi:hypothetical protein